VVKGPTERFMQALRRPPTAAGVASLYAGLIDAMVVDEDDPDPPPTGVPTLAAPTLMEGAGGRIRVARTVLDYAASLAGA
jgi:LPPG:FO 2-phospho-L-lactate transferase